MPLVILLALVLTLTLPLAATAPGSATHRLPKRLRPLQRPRRRRRLRSSRSCSNPGRPQRGTTAVHRRGARRPRRPDRRERRRRLLSEGGLEPSRYKLGLLLRCEGQQHRRELSPLATLGITTATAQRKNSAVWRRGSSRRPPPDAGSICWGWRSPVVRPRKFRRSRASTQVEPGVGRGVLFGGCTPLPLPARLFPIVGAEPRVVGSPMGASNGWQRLRTSASMSRGSCAPSSSGLAAAERPQPLGRGSHRASRPHILRPLGHGRVVSSGLARGRGQGVGLTAPTGNAATRAETAA